LSGNALFEQGFYTDAIEQWAKIPETYPNYALVLERLGQLQAPQHHLEKRPAVQSWPRRSGLLMADIDLIGSANKRLGPNTQSR